MPFLVCSSVPVSADVSLDTETQVTGRSWLGVAEFLVHAAA